MTVIEPPHWHPPQSRPVYFAIRCWGCKWMFNRPAEQPERLICRACESKL